VQTDVKCFVSTSALVTKLHVWNVSCVALFPACTASWL